MSEIDNLLTSPVALRGVTLRNRTMISPMCMYAATDGIADDFHLVHLGRYALGGAGLVCVEATAIHPAGRITKGCLGLWSDGQIAGLQRIVDFLHSGGAAAAIQLGHAGPRASCRRPWEGALPLGPDEEPWPTCGPSAIPPFERWPVPAALDLKEMARIIEDYCAAAKRADTAGFDVLEVHAAHGYLLHSFLSPLANQRADEYGGPIENRLRYPLAVVAAVRAVWPAEKPLFVRISSVDGADYGWSIEDSILLARELKRIGVDMIDCSSGGMALPPGHRLVQRAPGYHVPYAAAIRAEANIATIAVGLIRDAVQAEGILREGKADIIAIAREALFNPNWPLMAAVDLEGDTAWERWPEAFGLRLKLRAQQIGEARAPKTFTETDASAA